MASCHPHQRGEYQFFSMLGEKHEKLLFFLRLKSDIPKTILHFKIPNIKNIHTGVFVLKSELLEKQ